MTTEPETNQVELGGAAAGRLGAGPVDGGELRPDPVGALAEVGVHEQLHDEVPADP